MCINVAKCVMKKWFDTNNDVYLALVQIQSTQTGLGLLIPATLLLNRSSSIMLKLSRSPILSDHDNYYFAALIERKQNTN